MILNRIGAFSCKTSERKLLKFFIRSATVGFTDVQQKELTPELKHDIERHWRNKLVEKQFDPTNRDEKFYVLSMFPYPSGSLHMGHVRVYTISDCMARFYRLNGKNVLHPMGWDAFGLPAENAANQRNIPADVWTKQNISHMKDQLLNLGCSFDWCREFATSDVSYYKWTQSLFLKLHKAGLVYQKEALVNWDPIDKTVLANEQVDDKGFSWRSGAKVEKKSLRQWFVKATKFSKSLLDGLSDPLLEDWRDIINLQRHWIGECDGFSFDLNAGNGATVNVWTKTPEHFRNAAFIAITSEHTLNGKKISHGILDVRIENPFTGGFLPVVVTDEVEYPQGCDSYLGVPAVVEFDKEFAERNKISIPEHVEVVDSEQQRQKILSAAQALNIGGYACSSYLKDWLISRQRNWGTPIPMIHCETCGAVPVNESDLPVVHSMTHSSDSLRTTCPNCQNPNAQRERDTMDTFVDSSWYFLRFLDSKNDSEMFDKSLAKLMPVDLYIGGKEHAVLHLYYARFVNHFLHSIGLVTEPEPFKRLLIQGMVMGRSFRVKNSGKYLRESEVKVVNAKKNQAEELSTGKPVIVQWEKMSKSKFNGVDPAEVIAEHSCDSVRLIMLGDVAPTSHRNWTTDTFPGILGWQKRLWLTVNEFQQIRADDSINKTMDSGLFAENEEDLFENRNFYLKGITFNYRFSHQLSVAITKMQGLTKSIRRAPKEMIKFGAQYERTLAALIIMLAPMAPHFASELWYQFLSAPNRINQNSEEINWNLDVLEQRWPNIDVNYELDLKFKVNGKDLGVVTFTNDKLKEIDLHQAQLYALQNEDVVKFINDCKIVRSHYVFYPECWGVLNLFLEERKRSVEVVEQ